MAPPVPALASEVRQRESGTTTSFASTQRAGVELHAVAANDANRVRWMLADFFTVPFGTES
ncbi:MAG: hypothetical protein ACR2OG_13465 [Gemmatimonadaceae bacterium]